MEAATGLVAGGLEECGLRWQRLAALARFKGMTVVVGRLVGGLFSAGPWPIWPGVCVVMAVVAGWAWLAERARRATLVALLSHAPPGTVVVQQRGMGGPAMTVHLGAAITKGGHSDESADLQADSR